MPLVCFLLDCAPLRRAAAAPRADVPLVAGDVLLGMLRRVFDALQTLDSDPKEHLLWG